MTSKRADRVAASQVAGQGVACASGMFSRVVFSGPVTKRQGTKSSINVDKSDTAVRERLLALLVLLW